MNLGPVIRLFHHSWNVRVIAALHASRVGARFVVLSNSLGVSKQALTASLRALTDAQLIQRNPGYGHPLRPEYVLTLRGKRIAAACATYQRLVARLGAVDVAYRKWSAPALLTLRSGDTRFGAIQSSLGGVSPRALSEVLKALCRSGLAVRNVDDGYPPRATYGLSPEGTKVATAAARIANDA